MVRFRRARQCGRARRHRVQRVRYLHARNAEEAPRFHGRVPLQRFGTEAEMSAAIVYLLSPAAAYITGTCLRVDGGTPNARTTWKLEPHNRSGLRGLSSLQAAGGLKEGAVAWRHARTMSYACVRLCRALNEARTTIKKTRRRGGIAGRPRRGYAMAGLYFEQFSVGQTFVHEIRRTVTDMDNMLFSALTYNPAAVHIDHEYAKIDRVRQTADEFDLHAGPGHRAVGAGHDARDHGRKPRHGRHQISTPVFAGDTLRAETKVLAVRAEQVPADAGHRHLRASGFNQRDEDVVIAAAAALMMRRPA